MTQNDKGPPRLLGELPAAVLAVVATVREAGGEAYVVGGAVRDALLGRRVTDWDLATSMRPDALAALFPTARDRDLQLGAISLTGEGGTVVVTSFREEADYRDHRHPDVVRFVDEVGADAPRRDFTVNAIYVDAHAGELIDPCGGRADLDRRVLRAIGDPRVRLAEDPLRMLRAVRFAASCGLDIDEATAAAMTEHAGLLRHLSAERVFAELTRAFTGDGRGRALRLLIETGLADVVLPEVVPMDGVPQPPQYHPEGDVLTHVCMVLDEVVPGDAVQAWSAVLHDIGKPPTFERAADRIRFSGHDQLSARMAEEVLQRLRVPRAMADVVVDVCRDHIRFASLLQMGAAKRERWLRSPDFPAHLAFHRADCSGSHGDLSIYDEARKLLAELPPEPPPPLCQGADVLALGVAAGPVVGEILRELQRQVDRLESVDRSTALSLLETIVGEWVKQRPDGAD